MDKWTDNIRKQAGDYKRKAPEGLLDDIKKEMARRGVVVSPPATPQKNLRIVWGQRVAIAAAAAAIAALVVVTNMPDNKVSQIADTLKKENPGNSKDAGMQEPSRLIAKDGGSLQSNDSESGIGSFVSRIINGIEDKGETIVAMINGTSDNASVAGSLIADNNEPMLSSSAPELAPEATEQHPQNRSMQKKYTRPQEWYTNGSGSMTASVDNHSGFSLSANYSGMGSHSNATGDGMSEMNSMVYSDQALFASLPQAQSETNVHAHHNMPIKVGVNLRYNINNRWSVQTGVNYSYLSSDIERDNNLEESTSKQKLHYVSVPVSASYSIWHNKNFNVYATAGGEAAKLVKGKADVNRTVYGHPSTNTKENISEHRMQYSTFGAAGVEYKPTNSISIYAVPGVTHYFNNHSSVVNTYKDKPTQFTINVGIRLNLNK